MKPTPEEIKQIAIECGAVIWEGCAGEWLYTLTDAEQIEFAKRIAELQLESDAKICDNQADRASTSPGNARADSCARAIRNNTGE